MDGKKMNQKRMKQKEVTEGWTEKRRMDQQISETMRRKKYWTQQKKIGHSTEQKKWTDKKETKAVN